MKRQIVALFLLVMVFYNLIGFYLAFNLTHTRIKREAAISLSKTHNDRLSAFRFTHEQFSALHRPDGNDREFSIDGEMYDVKEIRSEQNYVIVYAKHDVKETNFLISFVELLGFDEDSEDEDRNTPSYPNQPEFDIPSYLYLSNLLATYTNIQTAEKKCLSEVVNLCSPPPDSHQLV